MQLAFVGTSPKRLHSKSMIGNMAKTMSSSTTARPPDLGPGQRSQSFGEKKAETEMEEAEQEEKQVTEKAAKAERTEKAEDKVKEEQAEREKKAEEEKAEADKKVMEAETETPNSPLPARIVVVGEVFLTQVNCGRSFRARRRVWAVSVAHSLVGASVVSPFCSSHSSFTPYIW